MIFERSSAVAEEPVDGVEQVVDVVPGGLDVVDVAVVVAVGRADERAPVPGQGEDRAVLARGDDAGGVGRCSGRRTTPSRESRGSARCCGISSSPWISSGRIRSAHTPVALTTFAARTAKRSPDSASTHTTPAARPSVFDQVHDLGAVQRAPRRSARPRPGSSGPAARRRSGSRRRDTPRADRAAPRAGISAVASSPGIVRWRSGDHCARPAARSPTPRRAGRSRGLRSRRPEPTRVVAITSYMFRPIPISRFLRSSPSAGTRNGVG